MFEDPGSKMKRVPCNKYKTMNIIWKKLSGDKWITYASKCIADNADRIIKISLIKKKKLRLWKIPEDLNPTMQWDIPNAVNQNKRRKIYEMDKHDLQMYKADEYVNTWLKLIPKMLGYEPQYQVSEETLNIGS